MKLPRRSPAQKDPERAPSREQRRRILQATVAAIVVAVLVLVVAILPAEYGIDPTGIGKQAGFTRLSDGPPGNETPANSTTLYKYRLTWPTQTVTGANTTGYTAEGQTTNVFATIENENVTRLVALLTWSDDNETGGQRTRPDLFELQVVGPDGTVGPADLGRNGPDGAGNVTAGLAWRSGPPPREVRAETDGDAAKEANGLVPTDRSGTGTWTIRVSMLDAGDVDAQGVAVPSPAGDQGNAWNLALTIETYRFDAASLNASREREDRIRIDIPAGTGLEYKFDLEEGAPLEYAWNTTGERLDYDFHGERRDDMSGAFTSHKSGSASRDAGSFTAPFAGTHGWYWENRGTEPVAVELTTSGVYKIIGRK